MLILGGIRQTIGVCAVAVFALGVAVQCGDDSGSGNATNTPDASAQNGDEAGVDASPNTNNNDGGSAAFDGSTGPNSPACSSEALAIPKTAKTFYVAIAEPGADDAACDGLAATNEGNGHCPWKSLDVVQSKNILANASSVTVALRAGTYLIKGFGGFQISGVGKSENERLVLTRYLDEAVILDTGAPDGAGCPLEDASAAPPECVRQNVVMSGDYVTVQGLTIRNALGYQLEVRGGTHKVVRCNHFDETAEFIQRSDQLKLDGHATDVHLEHNEFSKWRSQAIDVTEVEDVYIEENDFHHPHDTGCGATGGKKGAKNIFVRRNSMHDIASAECLQPQSFVTVGGGDGKNGTHADSFEAENIHIVENKFTNIVGRVVHFVSCKQCSFERNDITNVAAGGVALESVANGLPECTASQIGCLPSTGLVISGNRMKGLDGKGDPKQANVFFKVDKDGGKFTSGTNLYCSSPGAADAKFFYEDKQLNFADWKAVTGEDSTSTLVPATDPACLAF